MNGHYVDGYDPERRVIYEIMDCLWHSCKKCYLPETINPVNDTSRADLKEDTTRKVETFKRLGYQVVEMWECEFREQLEGNADLTQFIQQLTFDAPLEPRDAFFGGRTIAVCLCKEVSEEEKIHYVDFTSLYPWTNKYGTYPISHPEILTSEALMKRSPHEFYGLIKCDVLPPSFLFHPVLPYRTQGKLMFPLCRTCTETLQQTPGDHTDEQRLLSGTWCSIEIEKAQEVGYRVVRMKEVWHFPEKSSHLFSGYIDTFLKSKQEASGWPSWCDSENKNYQYISEHQDKEGILAYVP